MVARTIKATAPRLVAYYRVSTARQGESGLGLEGQDLAVSAYAAGVGGDVVREFTEVETGTRKRHRPVLAEALAFARRVGARLVIAKLDRLARNVHFVSGLMESGVDFVACDNPHANRLTIHILAAVAEEEARMISVRVTASLEAYRVNRHVPRRLRKLYPGGVPAELAEATAGRLGAELPQCRNLTAEGRARGQAAGGEALRAAAVAVYADLAPRIQALRAEGRSLREIADALNAAGDTTRTGSAWTSKQVQRVLGRIG
jgi:DNA invertase Pin-like site-specific DNA recombinase